MRSFTTKIIAFFMLLMLSQSGFSQNWQLVWSDEFNGNSVGPDWVFETGAGGWGNAELEYYRQENASVSGGNLLLTAKQENFGGANYTSVRMKTQGRKSWKYGKIEANIAVPSFNGAWPAFWMLGDNIGSVGWPACGEIDIMEHVNGGNADFGTIHWDNGGHQSYTNSTDVRSGITAFHKYTIIWTDKSIKWLVDDVQYAEANIANNINGTEEFQKNFFILLNFAIGGQWPGYNIDNGALPNQMKVDYVRVYQDNGTPPPPVIPASTDVVTAYVDCNYQGFSGGFPVGDYNLAKMKSLGINDDVISSLRITQGFKALLYQDDNFGGAVTEINSDNACLNTTWNDKVTSLRIIPNGITNLAGTYYLQNRNSNLNLDVTGGTGATQDGAKMQQWNVAGTTNQQFKFEHLGDGAYKVSAVHSGKVLDIDGVKKDDGAFAQQWTYFGSFNQQWIVVGTDLPGCYKLIAKHSGKVLEVAGASTALEARVQQWTNNNQTCGQWKFNAPVSASTGLVTTYKDADYTGFSGGFSVGDYNLAALRALGVDDNSITSVKVAQGYKVILYFDDNFTGQSLEVTADNGYVGNFNDQVTSLRVLTNGVTNVAGTYYLQNRNSGLNMDVNGVSTADGANIMQGTPNGGTNQQFKLTHLGDGTYQVLAVHSNKSVDVDAIKTNDGANVQQWTYLGSFNQQFIVVATDLTGCYKLIAKHSGKVVEVAGASTANGANVQQWTNNNQTCGQWKFMPLIVVPPVDGTGDGLTGNYFNGMNFETPVYSRKDATVNFDWGGGSPNAAVNADGFSARWTGQIQPKYSGEYTFFVNSDNGRRLWINGQLVIDAWIDDWNIDYNGKITLTANQKYDIKLEYFENYGGAGAKLEWSHASQTREVVPTKQLYSNNLPTVSITAPASTAVFESPASITFTSSAADNGGSVAKVEYYNGATKIGQATANPYSFTWSNVAAGTYAITARATDNLGGITVSIALSVKVNQGTAPVNQAPSVTLTAPANGASYNAPASITITANASDNDGTVAKVEFYNGSQKLGEDASSPYSYTWSNVAAGTYTISVKAFDDKGASTTSGSVSVTVKTVVVDACSSIPAYVENNGYVPGSKVKNAGRLYECKEFPYSGWCNGAAWAYGAGTGAYWSDAWYDRGSCGARTGEEAAAVANEISIAPNPASDFITIQLNAASTVSVYNSQGTEVLSSTTIEPNGTLNISSLAAGMYVVKIDTGSAIVTKMILKK
jgi:beta-glucanase (GH16 family)